MLIKSPLGWTASVALALCIPATSSFLQRPVQAQTVIQDDDIVRTIMSRSGRGDQPLGESIATLARLDRFAEANQLLQSVDVATLEPDRLSTISRAIGSAATIRLLAADEVTDQSREVLRKLTRADQARRDDRDRLRQSATILIDPNASRGDVAVATRTLGDGGRLAIKAIVEQLVANPNNPAMDRRGLQTAVAIDADAGDAVVPWIMYGSADELQRAVTLLSTLTRDDNKLALAIGQHLTGLATFDADSFRTVGDAFENQRLASIAAVANNQTETVWVMTVAEDGSKSIDPVSTARIAALYRRDADLAAGIGRIVSVDSETYRRAFLANLSYRVLVDPDWGDDAQLAAIRRDELMLDDGSSLLDCYRLADDMDDSPAKLGCLRLAASVAPDRFDRTNPLLVECLDDAVAQIRFEAAIELQQRVRSGTALAGQSIVKTVLAEAVRLSDRPTVCLVETRSELIGALQQRTAASGNRLEVFPTVASLVRRIALGGDIRLVLSKKQLADQTPIELVDRVHRMPRRRQIVIAFYRDPEIDDNAAIYSGTEDQFLPPETLGRRFERSSKVIEVNYPRRPETITRMIQRGRAQDRLPPLSPTDRQFYRSIATGLIE